MTFYTRNLYDKVIKEPSRYFNNLKIISGYASSKFLQKVLNDLPNHKICLIIGMALKGISIEDHQEFKSICTNFSNVDVFYKVEDLPNHMKLYQWFKDDIPEVSFIGSANFSNAAFFGQEEIISPSIDIFSHVIDNTLSQSISCLDKDVELKIPLYESRDWDTLESEGHILTDSKLNDKNINRNVEILKTRDNINLKKLLLNNLRLTPFNHVTIELILRDDPHWKTKALNNWNRKFNSKNDSYIDVERTNRMGINKLDFFPRDTNIQLFSDDNVKWTVKRVGEYGRELKTISGLSFYEYFMKRLDINEDRPISFKDLDDYGRTNIDLYKINDDEYLLDFSLDKNFN